ncbi:MAG TPA: hypothetical protein VM243_12205 [Phycisphaerae bacterium]|nr:hypothetical protein [Phycisphaerae bacterium]
MMRFLTNRRAWTLALLAGAVPLGTVATCDGGPGGGSLFYDRIDNDHGYNGGSFFGGGPSYGYHDDVIIVEDYAYDEVYYDDYYYDDYYYEEDYCDPLFFWDCW